MKTKADYEAAERAGYAAYLNGRDREDCPEKDVRLKKSWLHGFDYSESIPHGIDL